jgi:Spo0E like sporulation regulatory protein.
MNEQIRNTRNELNKAIEITNSTQSQQVMELSQKLDLLILDYYKKTMSFSFHMSDRS